MTADAPVMHRGQSTVTADTVRRLVAAQFPRWAHEPVRPVASTGTVNAVFRIGEGLAARFPLVVRDAEAVRRGLETEARATAELADRLTVPVPRPVAIGVPGPGFPGPWSVQTWLPGRPAEEGDAALAGSRALAGDVAGLVREVRAIPADGRTFAARGIQARGGELRGQDDWMETCFAESTTLLDVPRLRATWARLRRLPRASADAMTHGDLVPANLLVDDAGRLCGVLDAGGFGAADPALDLVVAWHLFADAPREAFRLGVGADDLQWRRGAAWAFAQAMGLVWYYRETNPAMAALGRRTLERVLAAGV